jgi:hypothetical protein
MSRRFILTIGLAAASFAMADAGYCSTPVPRAPDTEIATRSADLIDRAARALIAKEGESHVTRLWVFPTADANTVFVHYRWTADSFAHEPGATTERLVLMTLDGERIADMHDLTRASESLVAAIGQDGGT